MEKTAANMRIFVVECTRDYATAGRHLLPGIDQGSELRAPGLRALADRAGYDIVGAFTEKASGARNDRQERKKVLALSSSPGGRSQNRA